MESWTKSSQLFTKASVQYVRMHLSLSSLVHFTAMKINDGGVANDMEGN